MPRQNFNHTRVPQNTTPSDEQNTVFYFDINYNLDHTQKQTPLLTPIDIEPKGKHDDYVVFPPFHHIKLQLW